MPLWVTTGYQEYAKRLPKNFQLNLIEIPLIKRTKSSDIDRIILQESEKLLTTVPKDNLIIALDERGKPWKTLDLAKQLRIWHDQQQDLSLLIGGPDGIADKCLNQATFTWSLSSLTFPHPLVRVIIAEQIYRAWTILEQHPYHRS